MRHHLLNSVAVAALSLTVAGAWAQDQRSRPESGASPSTQSEPRNNTPARGEQRGEERSPQGQRASEGAGREGAGRNASERGQERGERAQPSTAQQGREQNRDQNREQSSQQQQQRDQDRNPTQQSQQGQQGQQNQPSAQRNQDQQRNEGTRSSDTNRQQGAQDRDRSSPSSAQGQPQDRNRDNATSSTTSSSSTRTGERSGGGQTNVQVRGEFNVDQQAATRVHDRLIRESDARSNDLNINIDVGRNVPNSVRLRPVPRDIVEINPRYRDYEYTIVRDEIVIVEPRTKRVVQIISSGSGSRGRSHMVRLDTRQRDLVKRDVMRTRTGSRGQDLNIDLREGVEIPDRVTLQTFPEEVWREVPDLREIRYIIVRDELVLVDPDTREVIEIIR